MRKLLRETKYIDKFRTPTSGNKTKLNNSNDWKSNVKVPKKLLDT